MAARLIKVFCRRACWDAAHQSRATVISSRLQNSPGTSRRPTHLASVLGDSPRAGAASPRFDAVNERQRPRGTAPCFYCGGPAGAPLTVGALVLTSAPSLSLPSDSRRPSLRAGWEVRVSPLWDAVQMMGDVELTERRRTSTSEEFSSGMFLPVHPPPPSSVARILYLTEL